MNMNTVKRKQTRHFITTSVKK